MSTINIIKAIKRCLSMKSETLLLKKDLLLLANKLLEKVPDLRNAKEHYEFF